MSGFRMIAVVGLLALMAVTGRGQDFVPNQILIRLDPQIADGDQHEIVRSFGVKIRLHYDLLRGFWVDCPGDWDVLEKCAELARDPRVEFAHPNWYGTRVGGILNMTPNDPDFANCWGLENLGQGVLGQAGVVDADIDAPEAWCVRTDATDAVIAIIDSGVLLTHPDIQGNLWQNPLDPVNGIDDDGNGLVDDINGWDYSSNDNVPEDNIGHGTNVTGVAVAIGDNGIGTTGVCWEGRAMILKDGEAIPQAALTALSCQYAAAHDVAVVNLSTSYPSTGTGIGMLQAGFAACRNADIIICVSAGNQGTNVASAFLNVPMTWTDDNMFVIAATDNSDALYSFSNFSTVHVDISAPGVLVYTTKNDGTYEFATGTSFSAPMAAGSVALVRAQNPTLTYTQVINYFMANGDVLPALSTTVSGMRINLDTTIRAVPVPSPEYQVNSASASFDVDGVTGGAFTPALVPVPSGMAFTLNFSSNSASLPWDLGYATNPLVPRSGGAFTVVGGQVVNLDLADPAFGTWFDYTAQSFPFFNFSLSGSVPVPATFSLQTAHVAPGLAAGVAFSQPVRLVIQ